MKKLFNYMAYIVATGMILTACNNNSNGTAGTGTDSSSTNNTSAASGMGVDSNKGTSSTTSSSANTDTSTMQSQNTNMGSTTMKTNDFVNKAAMGGMMEVELGKVAQQNASSQAVKDFGSMMVKDHTKANDELKATATGENIDVPASLDADKTKMVDDLKSKTGADFDKAYMMMMLNDHNKTIAEFQKASKSNENEKVKAFATKTLPVLQQHLSMVKSVNSKLK